jgi:hypothetical protein
VSSFTIHNHPPSSLANASRGWGFPSSSTRCHPPHSQTRAEGGFPSPPTTTHPPCSQTRAGGEFFHHLQPPTLLARKRKPGVGFPSNYHHPTFLSRERELEVGLSFTPTLLARKREPGMRFPSNYHHPTLLTRKREPEMGSFTSHNQPPSSLANASRGWVFPSSPTSCHPILARKRELGWVSSSPTTTPPSLLVKIRAEVGCSFITHNYSPFASDTSH